MIICNTCREKVGTTLYVCSVCGIHLCKKCYTKKLHLAKSGKFWICEEDLEEHDYEDYVSKKVVESI